MSDKKYIDRLFQEQLKDLEKTPDPKVWKAIETELKAKNKRKRIIPIWWYGTGAAALLLLFLALNHIVNQESTLVPFSPNTIIVDTYEVNKPKTSNKQKTDVDTNNIETKSKITKKTKTIVSTKSNKKQTLKTSLHSKNNSKERKATPLNDNIALTEPKIKQQETKTSKAIKNNTPRVLAETTQDQKQAILKEDNSENSAIEENKINSLSIEEAIAGSEIKSEKKDELQKWDIQPNVAPVYYSSFGTGSHLDEQFINNAKSGEINASYGVNVGYVLNEKLKIRSGINNLKLSFNTNDVISNSNTLATNTSNIANLSVSNQGENLSFYSNSNTSSTLLDSPLLASSNSYSEINQNISYFEVPLELEYNLINKRIGISLIGGFSTFILEDNHVYSQGNNSRVYIGEATNINAISFSTNLGIGLDYNFSKRFNFNLEPTFKYQLNAFSNTSGNFKPYIIGFYTGFNYRF